MWGLGSGSRVRGLGVVRLVSLNRDGLGFLRMYNGSSPSIGQKTHSKPTAWVCLPEVQGGTRLWTVNHNADDSCTHPNLLGTGFRVHSSVFMLHVSWSGLRVEGTFSKAGSMVGDWSASETPGNGGVSGVFSCAGFRV